MVDEKLTVGVAGIAKSNSGSSWSRYNGVDVERGTVSSLGIWNAKLVLSPLGEDVPENDGKVLSGVKVSVVEPDSLVRLWCYEF